jgi:MoaA/NifB/PqqE/SkfB family radical SAM enzyme
MPSRLAYLHKRLYEATHYRLRTFAGGRWASRCRPTSIALLLTELCNARCMHCDIWKNKGKEDSPTADQWKTLLSDLRHWLGPVQITLTGGEALLKPYAVDLVAHGSSLGLFIEHLTHGYWDDQSKIEKLALARPWRITISLDGIGETHTRIRGREKFFEKTTTTIRTLQRVRKEKGLDFAIRLKTVVMEHNLDDLCEVARFAHQDGMDVFYQPIEQNYNTPEDFGWFEHSPNWPRDAAKAVEVVKRLMQLKREGLPIANSYEQLEVMIPYFQNPAAMRVMTQSHVAHEHQLLCAALNMLQIQANGDVTVCTGIGPVGNIKTASIRQIWNNRPHVWEEGCCLSRRCADAEQHLVSPTVRT